MFDRVIVPLDESAASEAALAYAEVIPSRSVVLVSVEPDNVGPMLASAPEVEQWRDQREADLTGYLNRTAAGPRERGHQVETVVAFGDPAARIVEIAERRDEASTRERPERRGDDLIVMGSHGRGTGGRVAFGSVTDRVARHATVPVLVVRGGPRPSLPPPLNRIVVALDGSARAEAGLATAITLAERDAVPIHLVRVMDEDLLRATVRAGAAAATAYATALEVTRRQADDYLKEREQMLRERGLSATVELRMGHPATELVAAVLPGDLLVLTTHGRGGVRRWVLGSVAEKLVRLSPAPTLLVRA